MWSATIPPATHSTDLILLKRRTSWSEAARSRQTAVDAQGQGFILRQRLRHAEMRPLNNNIRQITAGSRAMARTTNSMCYAIKHTSSVLIGCGCGLALWDHGWCEQSVHGAVHWCGDGAQTIDSCQFFSILIDYINELFWLREKTAAV